MKIIKKLWLAIFLLSCQNSNTDKSASQGDGLEMESEFNEIVIPFRKYENINLSKKVDTIDFQLKNGKLDGEFVVNFSNGKKYLKGHYVDGRKNGEFTLFNKDGNATELITFHADKLSGRRIKIHSNKGREFGYYESGELIYYRSYDADMNLIGCMMSGVLTGDITKKSIKVHDTLKFNYRIRYTALDNPVFKFLLVLNSDTIDRKEQSSLLYTNNLFNLKKGKNTVSLLINELDSATRALNGYDNPIYTFEAH